MHKLTTRNSRLPSARLLTGASALALALVAGCGASDSESADASPQGNADAAAAIDAAIADAGPTFDAADVDADAAVPSTSQRALWFGDLTTNNVDEVRIYDGTSGLSTFAMAGVTVIDDIHTIAVSPNGTAVAIALEHDGGTPTLYVANIDGTGTPIAIFDAADAAVQFSELAWSPNGLHLAYIADALLDGERLVFAVPADGSAAPTLVSQNPGNASQDAQTVAWTDDTNVVYRSDLTTDTVDNFHVSDIAASPIAPIELVPENLLIDGLEVRNTAAFAGGKIYFKSNHEGTFQLYRVDPNGANLEIVPALAALTNAAGAAEGGTFAISPDGASIAFSADSPTAFLYQVFVAPLDGTATLQSNVTTVNPTPTSTRGPVGPTAIQWSADGTMLAVSADWPIDAGDLDNDTAGYIVPATGAAGGVRIWDVGTQGNSQDVVDLAFTSDSSTLFARGDLRTNNDTEVYVTTDLTTADQDATATLTQDVPAGGDVVAVQIIP
jgi:Tol biopolymer transport system component